MKALIARIDRLQQRTPMLAVPIAVLKRFGEHGGGRLAATISYWSFFSIFPLLLAFVTVLGLMLRNDPQTREQLVDGALGQVPVIGTQLADADQPLTGSWVGITLGMVAALWTGLAAARALQRALDIVWDVPGYDRPNGATQRAKALGFLFVIAVGLVTSTVASNLARIFDAATLVAAAGAIATLAVNAAVLLIAYTWLTTGRPRPHDVLPGAVFAAASLAGLQFLGGWIVQRHLTGASDVYGTFAVVIALLSWFFLLSRIVLYGAELNAVIAKRLSPRSIDRDAEPTAADRRAADLDARRALNDERFA